MSDTKESKFNNFIIMQAQSAGMFLGQVPHPASGEKIVNLQAASSVIENLNMLREKTTGNLSKTEQQLLFSAIENLETLYRTTSSEA